MGVNPKAKDPEAAKKFLADFVSADGQRFRLSGGGNAVPSVPGLDEIVTEGNLPAHGKWFTEIAQGRLRHPDAVRPQREPRCQLGDRRRQADEVAGWTSKTQQIMAKKLNDGAA